MREQLESTPFQFEVQPHKQWEFEMTLVMRDGLDARWLEFVRGMTPGRDHWLRLPPYPMADGAHHWAMVWKIRTGESRLLLAHPEQREWVLTVALTEKDWRTLQERILEKKNLEFRELFSVRAPSNAHIKLNFEDGSSDPKHQENN